MVRVSKPCHSLAAKTDPYLLDSQNKTANFLTTTFNLKVLNLEAQTINKIQKEKNQKPPSAKREFCEEGN